MIRPVAPPPRRMRLVVQYDGTELGGFQRQRRRGALEVLTVQEALEAAATDLTGRVCRIVGAGRTDAGVHALGQVVHLDLRHSIPAERLARALNHRLPRAIRVVRSEEAPPGFHARRDATSRIYCYHLLNVPYPAAPAARFAAWVPEGPLDASAMARAVGGLEGEREFALFGTPLHPGAGSQRLVYGMRVDRLAVRDGQLLRVCVEGDRFQYRMVRHLVGGLLQVGRGQMPPEAFRAALEPGERQLQQARRQGRRAAPAAPACGLCLVYVHYGPPPAGLARCGGVLDTLLGISLE